MKPVLSWAAAAVCLLGVEAHAFGENLLSCQNSGFILSRCTLLKLPFSTPVVEDGTPYETAYTVKYDFTCSGHTSVNVGLSTGQQYVPFVLGAQNATLTLTGVGRVESYDPNPQATQSLSFRPGCTLKVTSATPFPSGNTLMLWTSQAQSQAKIINLTASLYLLAQDYQAIASWNTSKLILLRDKLEGLVAAAPTNIHYRVMLDTVKSALANAPPPYSYAQLAEAGEEVIAELREELDEEILTGQNLVNRFIRWQQQAEQSLLAALANAPA
ncbi:hypothetical protein [Melittangium boletus]|uniref:hypothetical protein n=1 Tax=Melittangium boletus TaxID=83453 RepID=UPI003DA32ED7